MMGPGQLRRMSLLLSSLLLLGCVGPQAARAESAQDSGSSMWTVRRPSGFSDVRCDARTIEGGPGAEAVAPGDSTLYTCKHRLLAFANFPNAPGNTVSELVYVDGQLLISTSFSFDGPNGSNTLTLTLPAGHHSIDVRAR